MTVENERLKLLPHSARLDDQGRYLIQKAGGERFYIPARFAKVFEMTVQGSSLAQIARFVSPAGAGRFAFTAKYLTYLHDKGLLADQRARSLAEALKPDYVWRDSFAFEEILSLELFRWPAGEAISLKLRQILGLVLLALGGGVFAHFLMTLLVRGSFPFSGEPLNSAIPLISAFVFSFTVARSSRALGQALAIRLFTGDAVSLRFRFDPLALSLETGDLSLASPSRSFLNASAGTLALLASPPLVAKCLPERIAVFVPIMTGLVLLADLSPFRRSALTEWLRALYNYWDRSRSEERAKGNVEARIRSLQVTSVFAWTAALLIFAAGPGRAFAKIFLKSVSRFHGSPLILAALFALALFVLLLSFLDDATESWTGESLEKIRERWRRRPASILIEEAIRDGQSPSREDLEKLPVIRQLDPEIRSHLLSRAEIYEYKRGESVCRQGEIDRALLILLSGKLAVAKSVRKGRRKIVALLDPGAVFGEAAFFLGLARTADVVATEECRVLSIPHDPRMTQLNRISSDELQFRIWFLQSLVGNPTWRDIPSEALDALVFAGQRKNFRAGEKVMSEGERADAFYFMIQGQATVTQNTRVINKVKAGEAFGEIALLSPHALRTATLIADTDLLTVKIETEKFWHLLGSHLPLGLEIERLASLRLKRDQAQS